MSAHTPGPWGVNGVLIDTKEYYVAEVFAPSLATRNADARLIAAAPDLLAVLKDAREELRLLREKDDCGPYDPTLKGRIEAAIAKAEGKS